MTAQVSEEYTETEISYMDVGDEGMDAGDLDPGREALWEREDKCCGGREGGDDR